MCFTDSYKYVQKNLYFVTSGNKFFPRFCLWASYAFLPMCEALRRLQCIHATVSKCLTTDFRVRQGE